MNRRFSWRSLLPILLIFPGGPVSAQPGRDLLRREVPFFQDYSLPHSKPDPYDETRPLELRVRSYLDANCSHCHRPEGVRNGGMDLRYSTPLDRTGLFAPSWRTGLDGRKLFHILPGDFRSSEVYLRLASVGNDAMPPMGRTEVDEKALALVREWINSLSPDTSLPASATTKRKSPLIHFQQHQETEIGETGLDSAQNLEVGIFDKSGLRMAGYSISDNANPRRSGWILRFSQAFPRGRYWMSLEWNTGKTTRDLLVF